jgi:hypothetical protein
MSAPKYLSRGIDYLGDLGAKLRDLQGFKTLAHELIQNADDVPDATAMTFDVCDHALIVDNDGIFNDCRQVERNECPWKEDPKRAYRCDFHRFRCVGAGDKRAQEGTTGAFGIGFVAVYQITDHPELLSAGRHWVLHEDRPEEQRIDVCRDCDQCNDKSLPNTRFIFPWAEDPQSFLRQAFRAETISESDIERLFLELDQFLPPSMLFLKHLRKIELKRNGQPQRLFQRIDEGNSLILTDGNPANDKVWHFLYGDFPKEAGALRTLHSGRIEPKRSSRVTVAIPEENACNGLLCAFLPTEQETGLPFHINADFFTTSDRKRLILEDDYQSNWNRTALGAAANALASNLDQLPELLGHQRFWDFLDTVKKVADTVNKTEREPALAAFWEQASPHLRMANVIFSTTGEWIAPGDCFLLLQPEEKDAIPALEKLGLKIVSEDLRPFQTLLRSQVVGVSPLGIPALCDALSAISLDGLVQKSEIHIVIADKSSLKILWAEIALLRKRDKRNPNVQSEHDIRLKATAIAPVVGGSLITCGKAYQADESTVVLFKTICPAIPFLCDDKDFEPLRDLCPVFDAAAAIKMIGSLGPEKITSAWEDKRLSLKQLFAWFENHRQEVLENPQVKQQLSDLAIFPSSGRLRKLGELVLPGNFDDYLGLAEIVDLEALGGRREFLRDLGMQALDFRTYALRLPAAIESPDIADEKRRRAVSLLAERMGEIRDDPQVRTALAATPLVECADGAFHEAPVCYFKGDAVNACLGESVFTVLVSETQAAALQGLYEWLGVAVEPRIPDLVQKVKWLAGRPYSHDLAQVAVAIIAHLGKQYRNEDPPPALEALRTLPWLPAKGKVDRWYKPNDLYAAYQAHLFETQALFVDIPVNIQRASNLMLDFLGIKTSPGASLVIKHILYCAAKEYPVHGDVYRFLNDKADDPAINQLKGKKCLYLKEHYVAPDQVFWGEHPFGSYRHRLGEELRAYGNLFKRLDVRDGPDHKDALAVLKEIAASFESTKNPLDDEAQAALLACWRLLDAALDQDHFNVQEAGALKGLKCVPNTKRMLYPPEWMFFENRAGLAEKFGEFLSSNVIPRPIGAARAMAEAGVRPLGTAVQVQLLECEDSNADGEIAERVRCRRNELGRILDAQVPADDITNVLDRLNGIRFEAARSLMIRFQLQAFNLTLESEPESVPALYLVEDGCLFFTRRNGQLAWPALSRELAIALLPDEDPGRIAAGIKEVLAAESASQAAQTLDELGYPRLDTAAALTIGDSESITALGTDEPTSAGFCPDESGESAASGAGGRMTAAEAAETILGPGAPKPTPPPPEMGTEPLPVGGSSVGQRSKGETAKQKRPVLRSYLPAPNADTTTSDESKSNDHEPPRSPVDEAGIRRVLHYEKNCGRNPKEMPHHNPGYDIESRDPTGKVLRYIEVKSLSGPWTKGYAVLSRPQFDKASRLGNVFWLYVVDQAETDEFQIHRIQNPAKRANLFMFDDGWRGLAEGD